MSEIIDTFMHTPSMPHQVAAHAVGNQLSTPSREGTASFLRNLADDIENGHFTVTALSRAEHLSNTTTAAVTLNIQMLPIHKPVPFEQQGQAGVGPFSRHR